MMTPQVAGGGHADPAGRPTWTRRNRRWIIVACLCVLALLAGTSFTAWLLVPPERQVGSTVHAYFDALAEMDWAAAQRVIAPEVIDELEHGDREYHSMEYQLAAQGYSSPEDVTVLDITLDGQHAVVELRFRLGAGVGDEHEASLRLRRASGLAGTVLHRWQILDPFATLDLRELPPEAIRCRNVGGREGILCVTLNSVRVADAAGVQTSEPIVLPGQHQVTVTSFDPATGWEIQNLTVVALPGAIATLPPSATPP